MKKRWTGAVLLLAAAVILFGALLISVWTEGALAADSGRSAGENPEPDGESPAFTGSLVFRETKSDQVELRISNSRTAALQIYPQAHYIDQAGSAGSWKATAVKTEQQPILVQPEETAVIAFQLERTVTHGDDAILAFFFSCDGCWYLGKVSNGGGTECYRQHD